MHIPPDDESAPRRAPRPGAGQENKARLVLLALCYGGAVLMLVVSVAASALGNRPLVDFLDEPQQNGWYAGFVSTVGGMIWWSGATVCFLTASIVRDRRGGIFWFWVASGALTTVLAVDDLFLLHEGPLRTDLGVPEAVTFLAYAIVAASIAVLYRRELRTMPWILLLVAIGFGGTSVAFDQAYSGSKLGWEVFIEDGAKLFAVTSWTLFFALACRGYLAYGRTAETDADG